MRVALIGASGFIGSAILDELISRGHRVTAIVRHPEKIKSREKMMIQKADVMNEKELAECLVGNEAVISAYNPVNSQGVKGAQNIINAMEKASIKRLLVVGGAGSLNDVSGKHVVDSPTFPAEWREGARATLEVYNLVKQSDLQWTVLHPAELIEAGSRTGKFRLGKDTLVINEKGESRISIEDYAMAMVDELEKPHHIRGRFTLAY